MSAPGISLVSVNELRQLIGEELDRRLGPIVSILTERSEPRETRPDSGRMLTAQEVARLLGLNRRSVRRLVLSGQLPAPLRIGKRAVRWHRKDIDAWVDRQAKAS